MFNSHIKYSTFTLRYVICFVVFTVAGYQGVSFATVLNHTNFNYEETYNLTSNSSFHSNDTSDKVAKEIVDAWSSGDAVIVPWTEIILKNYIKHKMAPSRGARGLALFHVAMHDSFLLATENDLNQKYAVSMAAASILGYLFPSEERSFERIVYSLVNKERYINQDQISKASLRSVALGWSVGKNVIERAENDGAQRGWNGKRLEWYGEGRFYGPGSWEPTAPYFYYPPEEPFAPSWKPWVIENVTEFRADPPPHYGSKLFVESLKEVIDVNKKLTSAQLKIAENWVDGDGSVTPAGHWNQIALEYVKLGQKRDFEVIQLFVNLNISMADTFIAAWDTKYLYWTIRPITAAKRILGIDFKPPILTPPFPSYVSGHAATSGAASQILAHHFPNYSEELIKKGDEAALSRLYGGIHYRFDNDEGLKQGRSIAKYVLKKYNKTN